MNLLDFTNPNEVKIFSIGYEGKNISDFISALKLHGIKRIIDVRRRPYSKNEDFSISKLRNNLLKNNIGYLSYPDIAPTDELREEYKEKKDISAFFKKYDRFLDLRRSIIVKWSNILKDKDCLLCYERNDKNCHRSRLYRFIKGIIIPIKV